MSSLPNGDARSRPSGLVALTSETDVVAEPAVRVRDSGRSTRTARPTTRTTIASGSAGRGDVRSNHIGNAKTTSSTASATTTPISMAMRFVRWRRRRSPAAGGCCGTGSAPRRSTRPSRRRARTSARARASSRGRSRPRGCSSIDLLGTRHAACEANEAGEHHHGHREEHDYRHAGAVDDGGLVDLKTNRTRGSAKNGLGRRTYFENDPRGRCSVSGAFIRRTSARRCRARRRPGTRSTATAHGLGRR